MSRLAFLKMDRNRVALSSNHDRNAIESGWLGEWTVNRRCRPRTSWKLDQLFPRWPNQTTDRIVRSKSVVNRTVGLHGFRWSFGLLNSTDLFNDLRIRFPLYCVNEACASVLQPHKMTFFHISKKHCQVSHVFR